MARPKIEEIEKIKRAAIELPDVEFAAFCDWLLLLAEVRQAEAKRVKSGGGWRTAGPPRPVMQEGAGK